MEVGGGRKLQEGGGDEPNFDSRFWGTEAADHSKRQFCDIFYVLCIRRVFWFTLLMPPPLAVGCIVFSTCPSVRPSVCYQSYEHDISKTNEPILLQTDTSGQRGKGMKRSNFGVRRSKVKVT